MDGNFLKRTASTGALVAIVVGTIYVAPLWWYVAVVVGFTVAGLHEFFGLMDRKQWLPLRLWGYLWGGALPVVTAAWLRAGPVERGWFEPTLVLGACIIPLAWQLMRPTNREALGAVAGTAFALWYVAWAMSLLVRLRWLSGGAGLVAWIILITKAGDIGAYLVGTRLGTHPLFPRVSPKKTVEGLLGGLVFSAAAAVAAGRLVSVLPMPTAHLWGLGLGLGVLAQVGDLGESVLKRDCQAKDSGDAIPGVGGTLDVLDSLLFTLPVFYLYVVGYLTA
ncbi:MAG: phosphatidate cytidylyltransferase [Candidatus Omnitrophica bacterium]|nr:phosphatidate cytidylyltransferase [Candidatus Omnitrophota bacterium]